MDVHVAGDQSFGKAAWPTFYHTLSLLQDAMSTTGCITKKTLNLPKLPFGGNRQKNIQRTSVMRVICEKKTIITGHDHCCEDFLNPQN